MATRIAAMARAIGPTPRKRPGRVMIITSESVRIVGWRAANRRGRRALRGLSRHDGSQLRSEVAHHVRGPLADRSVAGPDDLLVLTKADRVLDRAEGDGGVQRPETSQHRMLDRHLRRVW